MTDLKHSQELLKKNGYCIVDTIYTKEEINNILELINNADGGKDTFRRSKDLFAIRQFVKEIPDVGKILFNEKLKLLIHSLIGDDFFLVKSIYFDKPEQSNWFVAYHQDLIISVDQKKDVAGYKQWTVKQNQFSVQPPLEILESIYTLRIHLDYTDENNGALNIIPGSHNKGIYRPENINWDNEKEESCIVSKGGVMLMRPLLLHSSGRTVNANKRRVIHLEISNQLLSGGLGWAESQTF